MRSSRNHVVMVFLVVLILALIFQNCGMLGSGGSGDTSASPSRSSLALSNLVISPVALTLVPGAVVNFAASGGVSSSYRFEVIGAGMIDRFSGSYTAPSTANDEVVRVVDSTGAAAYAFVKVAAGDAPLALYPSALLLSLGARFKFVAVGGTSPVTFSVHPAGLGTIDAQSGQFVAATTEGQATVTATDSIGNSVTSIVKVQDGASTLAPMYFPNPLSRASGEILSSSHPELRGQS